jgi:hypothetical protein
MPVLTQGVALKSTTPTLLVENPLAVGTWRFSLTVVDSAGNESAPATLVVQVNATTQPSPPRPVPQPVPPRPVPGPLPNRLPS